MDHRLPGTPSQTIPARWYILSPQAAVFQPSYTINGNREITVLVNATGLY